MRNSEPQTRSRKSEPAGARWIHNEPGGLLPVLPCFAGARAERVVVRFFFLFLVLYLLVPPPHLSLGTWINGVLIGLIVLATLAFLPHSWFFVPSWRTALVSDFDIQLPSSLTPQPWVTGSCLL